MNRPFLESFAVQSAPILAEWFEVPLVLAQAYVQSMVPFDVNFDATGPRIELLEGGVTLPQALIVSFIGATLAGVAADQSLPNFRSLKPSNLQFIREKKAEALKA